MKKNNIRLLVTMAMMVAMHIILSRFLSINTPIQKIGFSFVPLFIAAVLYGPVAAGAVGAIGDFLGATLFPIGPYFPGFTVTCCLTGVVFGLLLHREQTIPRVAAATLVNQFVVGLLVNSANLAILYGSPYLETMVSRIPQVAILVPVEFAVMTLLTQGVFRRLKSTQTA